ncbi:MAG TPA: transporter substrate-binding domain-containing protein [Pseudomonas sp.]|uniref:transporter substrate-binding domain-containing protein n=1 Tax=Pseudomonas sp. TaxID=306 RepID=UPI002B4625D0|nr:transporter substrate-binding domain-containing protein [Pseudomonas sp.]HKS14892.1 transporter substrate-binding domain-containing protein [Pseudomonas sp.]
MRSTLLLLLALIASPWAQAELIDEVNDRGELRIAVQADTPPFSFKENDRLTGFAIELGQVLADELDVRAEFIETPADEVVPGVESGKYDIALDQVNATEQLDGRVDVSQPYQTPEDGKPSLVIPFQKGNPAFRSAVDNALQRIKDDGRLTALQQKWLEKQDNAPAQP